jgi:hypothetical protein
MEAFGGYRKRQFADKREARLTGLLFLLRQPNCAMGVPNLHLSLGSLYWSTRRVELGDVAKKLRFEALYGLF